MGTENRIYRMNGRKETAYECDHSDSPGDYPLGHFEQMLDSCSRGIKITDVNSNYTQILLSPRRRSEGTPNDAVADTTGRSSLVIAVA